MKNLLERTVIIFTMSLFVFCTTAKLDAKAPIDPNGNEKLEQKDKKQRLKKRNHQSYKLQSQADGADLADNLYTATLVGAIIATVAPIMLAIVGGSVNLTLDFVVLSLLGVSLIAIIFVVLGIIAASISIKLGNSNDFEGDSRIYWKALTLAILSCLACLSVIFLVIGSATLQFLVILLVTIAVAILHFIAAFRTKG